jgi:hypothetical protein
MELSRLEAVAGRVRSQLIAPRWPDRRQRGRAGYTTYGAPGDSAAGD